MNLLNNYRLDFCQDYGYPPKIRSYILDILELINKENVVSIIVSGSISRGELTSKEINGSLEIFGDFEFYIVVKDNISALDIYKPKIEKDYYRTKCNQKNMIFHVDSEVFREKDISKLPAKIRFFELKEKGQTVYGKDILEQIPGITPDTLDMRDTNDILYRRLHNILLNMTEPLLFNKPQVSELDSLSFKYILARNILDMTTIILAHKKYLIPSYNGRVEYISREYQKLNLSNLLDTGFPELLKECLNVKKRMEFKSSIEDLYRNGILYFEKLLMFILNYKSISFDQPAEFTEFLTNKGRHVFNDKGLRKVKFSYLFENLNTLKRLKIIYTPLKANLLSFLFCMHFWVVSYLEQENAAYLDEAENILKNLGILNSGVVGKDSTQKFFYLRKLYFEFWAKFMMR